MPKIILRQKGGSNNGNTTRKQGIKVYMGNETPVLKMQGSTLTITTPAKLFKQRKK